MKRTFSVLAVVVMLLAGVPAVYGSGFLSGVAAGVIIAGSNSGGGGEGTGGIIYEAPFVKERLKNPLIVKMASLYFNPYDGKNGKTLYELFYEALGVGRCRDSQNHHQYEILQIVRVFRGDSPESGGVWFLYTEKNNLYPVDNFPGKKNGKK